MKHPKSWSWLNLSFLASGHPKPEDSLHPALISLFIGTCVVFGILIILILLWVIRWRRRSRATKRPWWIWLGWGLLLVASVCAALWSAYFLGGGALGWVVPTLAAIIIPLYVLWYQQTNDRGEQRTVGDPNREDLTLADLEQVIDIVSRKLPDKAQVDSVVSASDLELVRYPTGRADPRQLWEAVFEAALDAPPGKLSLVLHNIRKHLGTRSWSALERALGQIGLS